MELKNIKIQKKLSLEKNINIDLPEIIVINKNGLNMNKIDYDNPNYLCFSYIENGELKFDNIIKSALNYNFQKFSFLYYDTIVKSLLDINIINCFYSILEKYNIKENDIFTTEHLEILKTIYNKETINTLNLLNKENILKYWKRYSFINYNKEKNTCEIKRKANNFIFEFNSNFWLKDYKKIIEKNKEYYNNIDKTIKKIQNDLYFSLKNEKDFITF